MPADDPTHCPACQRTYGYRRVLCGWQPCTCGGHSSYRCDGDGSCGHLHHIPERVGPCLEPENHAPRTSAVT